MRSCITYLCTSVLSGLLGVQVGGQVSGIVSSQALAPAHHEPFETRFVELAPDLTGLADFRNDFSSPHIWGKHWRTYLFGAIGTGVAIGDVDSDGKPDIFVVSKNEKSRLYRNLGDFRFEDITGPSGIDDSLGTTLDKIETPGGGAAFADVNNDGHLDLYLCFLGAPNQLWINDGTGTFTEQASVWGVDVTSASMMAYFADYDRDGLLDLYLATNLLQEGDDYPGPRPDHLFRNTGERFEETTSTAGLSGVGHAHSAAWWDYNGDLLPDIYVANDFTEVDWLYRNNGDGTFTNVIEDVSPRAPYYAMGSDFGDINGDGWEDFWVADMAPTARARYKKTLESHRHVYDGTVGMVPNQYMQNVLLLNLDGDQFVDVAALTGLHRTDWTWAVRLVDMDNDGWLDAYVTNGMLRNFNDGDLGMRLRGQNSLQYYAPIFKPTPVLEEANLAFKNGGDLDFTDVSGLWGLNKTAVSFGAAFSDLDGDGALDIVVNNLREPPSIYRNQSQGESSVLLELKGVQSNARGVGARVELVAGGHTQTKVLNPFRGYMSSDEPLLHFGLGKAETIESLTIYWPSGIVQRLGDLDANHRYLIEERGQMTLNRPPVTRFKPVAVNMPDTASRKSSTYSEFKRQPLLPFERETFVSAAAVSDLNNDGIDDLVLGGVSGQGTTVLLGGADFQFTDAWSLDLEEDFPSSDSDFALSDLNDDEQMDLVVLSGGSALNIDDPGFENRIYLGDGQGEFLRDFESSISSVTDSSRTAALGDFNQDGYMDLFVGGDAIPARYPESTGSQLWRGLPEGGFERVEEEWAKPINALGLVTDSIWVDLNKDKFPDLVTLQEWGRVRVWKNQDGKLEEDTTAIPGSSSTGMWTCLLAEDFDEDGRVDLAVGNLGLNTGGLWDPANGPRVNWWKAETRRIRMIEAHVENGKEWPLVWWDRLKDAIPGQVARARSYTEFAERSVSELFGDLNQKGYQRLEINDPRSGIFWQESNGTFSFEAFPAIAQAGWMVATLADDVTGDGKLDLVSAIVPPSLAPWTGRKESGLVVVLKNEGSRVWSTELAALSGLNIGGGSPRRLAKGDFNGDGTRELVVVLSEGKPLIFETNDR